MATRLPPLPDHGPGDEDALESMEIALEVGLAGVEPAFAEED